MEGTEDEVVTQLLLPLLHPAPLLLSEGLALVLLAKHLLWPGWR